MATQLPNGIGKTAEPTQLSLPLPHAPSVRINLHLTIQSTSIVLFLTTSSAEGLSASCSLGSFVYAIPNVRTVLSKPYKPGILINVPAQPFVSATHHTPLHANAAPGFGYKNGLSTRLKNWQAYLCRQFYELFRRWKGR
jgi:hypothetical protein